MKDFTHRDPAPGNRDPDELEHRTKKKRKRLTQRDKERIALNAIAELFGRDAAEIATDPRYATPEHAPLPIVGELQRQSKALRRRASKQ